MPLAGGTRLGPYEIVEPLGKGAMGEVYRARDARLGRDVAIKVLPEHTSASPDALTRFEFEARAVAALNHPNILALHDVGEAAGISYAVMELLDGETLRTRLARDGPLPPRKALELAVQFAHGLAAAHARGIIHRDLKPDNLFVTAEGRLKILDFGIAVHDPTSQAASIAETRASTEPGILVGTVGYMSPEQVRGIPASTRSDVFSFGLVVHEMVTGSNPFRRGTTAETAAAILRDEAPTLTTRPGLPAIAARTLDRCLEKRPEERPESLRDLAFVLEASGSTGVPEESPSSGRTEGIRRKARQGVAAACLLLAVLTAGSWAYVRARANRAVGVATAAKLARAENLVGRAQQERLERLRLSARLVASFPQLKALFETSAPTIRDFLTNYQRGNVDTPLLVALGPEGSLLARGDDEAGVATERGEAWLERLRAAGDAGLIILDGRPYHAAVASAEAGGTIFGSIIAAAPVDNTFAQMLREATENEVILLDERGVAGTSLRSGQVPWASLKAFRSAAAPQVTIENTRYRAKEVPLAREPDVAAVVLTSGDEITESYRGTGTGVLLIGLAGILILLVAGRAASDRLG